MLNFSDDYESVYIEKEKFDKDDCYLIELNSKKDDKFIKKMKIWIATKNYTLLKISQIDLNENENNYLLSNFETDVPISTSFFKYEIDSKFISSYRFIYVTEIWSLDRYANPAGL